MNVYEFYKALAARCGEGECETCGAREFCYTTPHSMTEEMIARTLALVSGADPDKPEEELNEQEDSQEGFDGPAGGS